MVLQQIAHDIRKYRPSRQHLIIFAAIVVLLAGGITLALRHGATSTGNTPVHTAVKDRGSNKTSPPSVASHPPSTNDADSQAAAHAQARPVTDACKLLTQTVATAILGSGAKTATPDSTVTLEAADTTVSICRYSSTNSSVELMIRKPNSTLGTSENATMFGSGKPSGAISVSGYGQTAYWDPSKHTLNVLGDNNWYVISRGTTGTQADVVAVAKLLATGF